MSLTENYLSLPRRLLIELRDTPLALALYFFIARLYLVQQTPIPLSRTDIRTFDPTARSGAVKRALDRLVQAHWLRETSRVGAKSTYVPVWGTSRAGAAYPWKIGADRLGCPMYIWCDAVRIDRALLDLFMGKFLPHPRNAYRESYFTRPLLRLHDIGTYILLAAELPCEPTDELVRWGLVRDDQVQRIPDDAVVVALASQRMSIGGIELTAAGWRKLGWFGGRSGQAAQLERAAAAPLIFVPKERIGGLIPRLIGQLIGCAASLEEGKSASEREKAAPTQHPATMTGIMSDSRDTRDTTPNPLHTTEQPGGGSISLGQKKSAGRAPNEGEHRPTQGEPGAGVEQVASARQNSAGEQDRPLLPDTEAVRLLWGVGARNRERLAELSATPPERVEEVIRAARARPAVIDKGGWAIAALSEGWDIALPGGMEDRDTPLKATDYIGGAYGDLFRLGSDMSDLDGRVGQLELTQPGEHARVAGAALSLMQPGAGTAAHAWSSALEPSQQLAQTRSALPQPVVSCRSAANLTQELRTGLLLRCGRTSYRVIYGLQVRVDGETTVIHCASLADRLTVVNSLMSVLRWQIAELGLPQAICVTDRPPDAAAT